MRRSVVALVAMLTVTPLAVACGSDGADPVAAPTTTVEGEAQLAPFDPAQSLPPNDVGSLRELYDPILAPLGLRLTRGALIDLSGGGYEPSNDGRHLALYAEPIAPDYSPTQYLDGFWQVSATVTPDVFARWSELESYDICLEPVDSVDDSDEPFPVTQVNLTREAASRIDWQGGELIDLITAGRTDPDVRVVVSRDIRSTPEYQTVLELSRAREPDTTSTTAAAANDDSNGFG
jgi:hypothetical protein